MDNNFEELNGLTLKKSDSLKKGALADDELDSVASGFREDADIPSKGYEIMCPMCHASGVDDIKTEVKVWHDGDIATVEYTCYKCFNPFVVFRGVAYKKDDFVRNMKKINKIYPY